MCAISTWSAHRGWDKNGVFLSLTSVKAPVLEGERDEKRDFLITENHHENLRYSCYTEAADYCNMKSEKLSSAVAQEILTWKRQYCGKDDIL